MAAKQFEITEHAVDQFIHRWEPTKSLQEAKDELEALLRTARSDGKSLLGDTIFVSSYRPEIRMVVRENNVCITVLPKDYRYNELITNQEEALIIQEYQEEELVRVEQELVKIEAELLIVDETIDAIKKERIAVCAALAEKAHKFGNDKSVILNRINVLKNKKEKLGVI